MDENYSKLVDIAYNLHVSGKLEDAKSVYEKLLSIKGDDVNVLNLYAQLNVSLKNYDKALEIFNKLFEKTQIQSLLLSIAKIYFYRKEYEKAIETLKKLKENNEESVRLYALSYMKLGNNERAAANYKALADNGIADSFDLYNLAYLYSDEGKKDEALKYALLSYEKNPDDIDTNKLLAGMYEENSDKENELIYLLNITGQKPDNEILYRIGSIYYHLGDDSKAVEYFNSILNTEPDNDAALSYIAMIFKKHDKKKSYDIYMRLYNKKHDDDNIVFNLYSLCSKMLDFEKALYWAEKYLKISDDKVFAYTIIADSYMELFDYSKAEEFYRKAYKINPDTDYIKLQLGYIASFSGRIKEAYEMYANISDKEIVKEDYTILKLREKKFEEVREGFYNWSSNIFTPEKIEKRARAMFHKLNVGERYGVSEDFFAYFRQSQGETNEIFKKYAEKAWKNQDITDKRLLVYSMHGTGDLFMFSRYLLQVCKTAKKIIFQVPASCYELFKYNFPDLYVEKSNIEISQDKYDYASSCMTLLYGLHAGLDNIPYSSGYIQIPESEVTEKAEYDFMRTSKKKIGIYWQGNPSIMRERSIKLKYFIPLFNIKNVQIYSFQMSDIDKESDELKKKLPVIDLAPHIKNYTDTAAFLKNIDILITIDTSIANLAGAMGIKTFLLLPFNTEWRWFFDTETTPWYDSVKIFKQDISVDWSKVIERVRNELSV